jgi:hypothetical protein
MTDIKDIRAYAEGGFHIHPDWVLELIEALESKSADAQRLLENINELPHLLFAESELIARMETAEKDAARYRWLRERVGVDFECGKGYAWMPCGKTKALDYVVETDCAIDAAISAMKGERVNE